MVRSSQLNDLHETYFVFHTVSRDAAHTTTGSDFASVSSEVVDDNRCQLIEQHLPSARMAVLQSTLIRRWAGTNWSHQPHRARISGPKKTRSATTTPYRSGEDPGLEGCLKLGDLSIWRELVRLLDFTILAHDTRRVRRTLRGGYNMGRKYFIKTGSAEMCDEVMIQILFKEERTGTRCRSYPKHERFDTGNGNGEDSFAD